MASLLKLYSLLLEQLNSPETIKKAELQRLLDKCWEYSKEIEEKSTRAHDSYWLANDYTLRARVRLELGMPEEAIKDCEAAIKLGPKYPITLLKVLATAKNALGKPEEAIKYFDEAIKLFPDEMDGYSWRAYAKIKTNDLKGAIEDFDKVIEIGNKHLKKAYEVYKEINLDKAIKISQEQLRICAASGFRIPTLVAAYLGRIYAKKCLGDYEGAKQDLKQKQILENRIEKNLKVLTLKAKTPEESEELSKRAYARMMKDLKEILEINKLKVEEE